jgi:hypothetical protein
MLPSSKFESYIYIYIERERERERESANIAGASVFCSPLRKNPFFSNREMMSPICSV